MIIFSFPYSFLLFLKKKAIINNVFIALFNVHSRFSYRIYFSIGFKLVIIIVYNFL